MKKTSAGLVCIILAVIIALCSVGCDGGGNELTYNSDNSASSSDNQNPLNSSQPSANDSTAETVLYPLTTQQGETVQVLSTTAPTTEVPTMDYNPVDIPTMPTTYVSTTTTNYVPPTYSYSTENQVTTKPPTTTQPSTEAQIKYVSVNPSDDTDGNFTDNTINLYVLADAFGDEINATKGTLTINFGTTTYKASYKVLSTLYTGESIQIDIGIPSDLLKALETSNDPEKTFVTITVPKGAIVSKTNVSNKAFTSIPIYY
ncbi:MAG: hypothetical protein ACI4RU_03630 [Acutalibacteraceae bacterium]